MEAKNKSSGKPATAKSIRYITIPSKLIYDKNNKMNTKVKYLYIVLKRQSQKGKVNIGYKKLMEHLKWKDKRTLIRCLTILKDNNYVDYNFDKITNSYPIELELVFSNPFISINSDLIDKALILDNTLDSEITSILLEKGIIYLYMLENLYNIEWGYACPSRKEIVTLLGISDSKLSIIIKYYHNRYICEYTQGERLSSEDGIKRMRNRYIVNIRDKNGKRRYSHHKSIKYTKT